MAQQPQPQPPPQPGVQPGQPIPPAPQPQVPPDRPQDPPGSSPSREEPDKAASPSRTPAERQQAKAAELRSAIRTAIELGRDPNPAKHDKEGGVPGGSPGRQWDSDPTKGHEPGEAMGASNPEPVGAKDHRPGEFEQPARWDAPVREHGDYAP